MGTGSQPRSIGSWACSVARQYLQLCTEVLSERSEPPKPLPKLRINREVSSIFDFRYEDFTFEGYDPDPAIKAPVAV